MEWVKIACNLLDHRKIKIIRSGPEGDTICLLWVLMIIEAGKCNRGGYLMISDNHPYSEETVSTLTGIALSTVRLGLIVFTDLGMIDSNDGAIFIKNWRKYQSEDKLEARREKERIRQQRHRAKEREKIKALPPPDPVSRDSETLLSRDVTLENRQDKSREEKTTTEQALLLVEGTTFAKISRQDLEILKKRHGPELLLKFADVAAEMWRRDHADRHNPGGYIHSLCSAMVVPAWYVPFEERLEMGRERQQPLKRREERVSRYEAQKIAAMEGLWASLSDEARKGYLEKATADMPKNIPVSPEVNELVAKSNAWDEAHARSHYSAL
jgi:predicted phage replisome organizer